MHYLTMLDLYCSYPTRGGIFSFMKNIPWIEFDSDNKFADRLYFTKHGLRRPAYCLEQCCELGYLDEQYRLYFSELLEFEFNLKWQKLFDTLKFKYDPISNYDMEEVEEFSETTNGTDVNQLNLTNTLDSSADSGYTLKRSGEDIIDDTITKRLNSSKVNNDDVFGWDSAEATPKSRSESTASDDETTNNKQIRKPDLLDTNSANNSINSTDTTISSNDSTKSGERNSRRSLTRKGNIGVTLSQQMISKEREIWLWNYFDIIFNDVNRVLTLSVY